MLVPFSLYANSQTLVDTGTDGRFACLLVVETIEGNQFNYNLLVRYTNAQQTDFRNVRFRKTLRRLRNNIASTRSRITTARQDRNSAKVDRLRARRVRLRDRLADIRECRNGTGEYVNGSLNGGNSSGTGDTDGGAVGGGDDTPDNGDDTPDNDGNDALPQLSACQVSTQIDFSSTPQSRDDNLFARIISGDSCTVGGSGVVRLRLVGSQGRQFLCSGTVVSNRVVLTAAHCLDDVSSSESIIRADVFAGGGTFSTTNLAFHPNFDGPDEANDVGVIVTNSNLPTNGYSIIRSSSSLRLNEDLVIAGYGLDENNRSGILRAGYNTISSFNSRSISLRFFDTNGDTNTCSGDSGGPLFVQRDNTWVLAGITSNGVRADCGVGDVSNFANLLDSSNRSFINSIVPGLLN